MSMRTEHAAVKEAQLAIRSATMKLVDHVEQTLDHDELGKVTYTAPGLITQLKDARPTGNEKGSAGTRGKIITPVSLDVIKLLNDIRLDIAQWSFVDHVGQRELEDLVIISSYRVCQRASLQEMRGWLNVLMRWMSLISMIFDPPKRWTISAPCPQCGASTVEKLRDGEYVRVPALQLTERKGAKVCHCVGCWTEWPEERFLLLAKAIET